MSDIEDQFNSFIVDFEKNLGKIEVDLALRVLYLERRIDQGKPKVELYVCYNDGVDIDKKKNQLGEHFPCLSTTSFAQNPEIPNCERVVKVECLTDLKTIHKLSQDEDIEHIHGSASLGSF